MWKIKVSGLVAGFIGTCVAYTQLFALKVLDDRVEYEKRYALIDERLRAAANSAMAAAPAELSGAIRKENTIA